MNLLASVNNLFGRSLKSLGFSSDEITNTLKLHNGKYNTPLSFSNLRLKLIAILKKEYNKLFKQKATGHSYVLAPEEYLKTNFYKPKRGESIVPTNIKNSITWVSQEEKERFERINGLSYFEIVRKNDVKGKEYSKEEIVKIFNQYDELEKIADKDLRKDKRNSLESTIKEIHKSYEIELPRVILPAFFQVEGKTVDIKKYVNSEGYLDTDRIPVEALTLFGFRIPYQSKGSGAGLKVAGFLPYEQKDTLFLPQEMIPQTGTDFDVDKFFVYFKNLEHNYTSTLLKRIKSKFKDPKVLGEVFRKLATEKDIVISSQLRSDITMFLYELQEDNLYSSLKEYGQIEGFNEALLDTLNFFTSKEAPLTTQDLKESTNIDHSKVKFNTAIDSIANAENKLLDVYLKSFSLNTIKDIIQPLGNDEFEAASREISALKRQGKELTTLNVVNDLNSYHYQKELYENNNFGKTALGIFVVGSIMNEVMRRNNPTIFVEDMKVDGKLVSYGNKYTLDGSIKKSKQFMQSSNVAVDVAKLGSVLKDSGITNDNISFVTTMMMFGLTFKQIFHIINSNPFKDYIASISSERTLLGLKGRTPNPIRDDIEEEVKKIGRDKPAKWNKYFKVYVNSDFNALNQLDKKGLYHFYKFLYFTELHGKRINQYISSFDGYRKGLPSTIIEVLGKISKIGKLKFIENSEKVLPFILEDKNFPTIYHNGYTQVMNSVNQLFPEYRKLIPEIINFIENSSSVKDRVIKEDALKKIEEDVVKYFTSGIVDTQKFKDTVGMSFTIEGVSRLYAHYPKIALNKLIELLPIVKNKITLSTSFINNLVIKTENNVNNVLYEVNKELNYDHKKELYSYLVNPDEDVDLRKVAMLIVALRYTLYSDQYSNAKFKDLVGFETEELIGYPEYTRGLSDQLESQELTSDLIYQLHMNNTDLWNTETNDKTIVMPDKDPFLTELRRNQIPFIVQPSNYSKFSVINTNYYVKVRKIDKENSVFLLVTPNTGRLVSKIKYNGYFEEAVDFRDINNKRNSLITSLIKEANLVEQLDEDSLESEIDQEIEYTEYVNPIPELRSRLANAPEHYKIFLEVFSPYLEDLKLEIGTVNQYNPNNNTITLAENSSDHVSIQHELNHALTVNNMERWYNSLITRSAVESMIEGLNTLIDKLSPIRTELLSLKEALSSNTEAKTLRSIVTDFLENNPSIESFITGMGVNVSNGDIATLTYSLSYLTDPITNPNSVEMFEGLAALSEPLFQELTSKIEYNGKSLLQTLVEKLRNLINSLVSNLGIEANENTVLINLLSNMYSLIDKDDLFETKEEKNEIKIPEYVINYNLINKDGSKRFASTNGKVINLNPVKTIDEFFDYFEGKEGGESSVQKLSVLNELSNKGYSLNKIKNILNSVKKINTFLILHEKDHIDNNDIDIYWKNGKDLLTKDKIDIEVRATLVALKTLENQTYSTLESQINYIEIEQKFKLRNLDGSRKRYSNFELLNSKVKKLNISNPEFKFRIGKVMGEKGDFKTYYSIFVESKTNPTIPLLTIESNEINELNELNENNTNEGEYSNKHGRFGKLIITGSGYKFLPSDESPFSLSTDKQESIYTGDSNGSNQSKDTKEIQKQDFARRVFNKLLYSESWYASAYKEITRVFPETSVVFIDQHTISDTFTTIDNHIVINLNEIETKVLFEEHLDSLLSEEIIHLVYNNIITDVEKKELFNSLSQKEIKKINQYYFTDPNTQNTLNDFQVGSEYIRMAVQQYLFNKTSEDDMLKTIKDKAPNIYNKIITALIKIKKFILNKISSDKFTTELVKRITKLEDYNIYSNGKVNQSLQEGLQWLHQIMPNVEPKLVGGLINNIANGSYDILEDLITLSKDFANKNVVKEEVFHKIFNLLPKEEQEKLLNEGSKKYGIERGESKATIKYSLADQNKINFGLKSVEILQSEKAIQTFAKGEKNKWDLNKILTELAIPKEQKELILSLEKINNKPNVILPIGTSGSGKSTFIKSLPQKNLVVIEPDAMRVEFTGDINNKSKDKEIYEEAAKRAITAIKQGKQVVFDTTNLTKEKRLPFIEAIKKEIPNANIQYKLMELNPELAKQRIKAQIERGENRANVPDSTIDRHAESYKQMLEDIKNEPISNFEKNIREEIITDLLANYSYTIEINTAKRSEAEEIADMGITESGDRPFKPKQIPTQYYSNLTVNENFYKNNPDWEYKEQRIATPLITPSIKGHAQFAEANDIGWFRAWYNKKTGEVHVLEVQSDLFQKGRDKEDLTNDTFNESKAERQGGFVEDGDLDESGFEKNGVIYSYIQGLYYKGNNDKIYDKLITKEEYERALHGTENKSTKNQFLQLLNKDSNWVTFFIKAVIQDSAKMGYEKVLFPSGNTASKIEGHTTLEEFKKQKEDRIKELESSKVTKEIWIIEDFEGEEKHTFGSEKEANEWRNSQSFPDAWYKPYKDERQQKSSEQIDNEINQLKQELERVETEGFGALRPIYNFYENTVTNILNKIHGKENVKQITDEYGNTWNEITLTPKMSETIRLNAPKGKIEYVGDLAIEEKIAEEAYNSKDEKVPSTLIGKFIQSLRNLLRNLFKERDNISRLIRNLNQGRIIPSNGKVIDNPVKPTKLTKTSFKYISNPEINPYKFTPDKGGYSDVVSRLKSRLITLKITDKNMVIKDPNMFSRLQESWTNQAEKLYNLVSIPKVMIEDNGKVKFRDYLFNEIDYKNGVITESNKSSGDRIKLEEAGLSQQNINHFFNNYFNESHTYSDGSSSESVNKEFSVSSYIEFINKRQRTNLDANSFNTIGEYINELNRLALEPNDISIGLLSSEEVDKRACKR
jgi:predicted kinase